jgi:hypothetical protein
MTVTSRTAAATISLGLLLAFSALPSAAVGQVKCRTNADCKEGANGTCKPDTGACLYAATATTQTTPSPAPVKAQPKLGEDLGVNPSSPKGGEDLGVRPSGSSGDTSLVNPLRGIDTFEELLARILEAVVRIGAIFLTAAIIWVGFLFVAARGNEEKLKNARKALMYAVIGGLILLGAQAIASVIQSTVGSLST